MTIYSADPLTIRILLVDENPIYTQALHQLLETPGSPFIIVASTPSAEECLRLIPLHHPDLIILKLSDSAKRQSALDFITRCRDEYPIIPVVVYTSDSSIETILAALTNGASCYLLHTSTEEELKKALYIAFSHGSVLSPLVAQKLLSAMSHPVAKQYAPTEREVEILENIAHGLTNKAIATRLYLSPRTVESHIHNLFEKLGVSTRSEAVFLALKLGFIVGDTHTNPKDLVDH